MENGSNIRAGGLTIKYVSLKKGTVTWAPLLHVKPQTMGQGIKLEPQEQNALIHYNYQSIDEYLTKAIRYAKAEASSLSQNSKEFTLKQAINKSLTEFTSRFLAQEGYRDGTYGFILSVLQMFYYFLVYFYFWEIQKSSSSIQELTQDSHYFFAKGLFEVNFWLIKKNLVSSSKKFALKIQNSVSGLFGMK